MKKMTIDVLAIVFVLMIGLAVSLPSESTAAGCNVTCWTGSTCSAQGGENETCSCGCGGFLWVVPTCSCGPSQRGDGPAPTESPDPPIA